MSDKLTKKDLHAKIESLEKELYLYKNRTQLARNYDIIKEENHKLCQKLSKKKEYWINWATKLQVAHEVDSEEETDEEDNL
tara:strand:- start:31 stop:273 length:243 start_codon:yes stop_codon:yes gene_type:complete